MSVKPLNEKTILITGASDGLGKQTALELAKSGAHLFLHGRNLEKTQLVADELVAQTGNDAIEVIIADFQSLKEVRGLAAELMKRTSKLDGLINNAGIFMKKRQISEDGFELTFVVNHLAPFLLTNLLLDLLKQSASARIVTVSSVGHKFVYLNPVDIQSKHFFWGWVNYCRSKLLNILFTFTLAQRLVGSQVVANCIHPGVIRNTNLTNTALITWGMSINEGAKSIVNLALSSKFEGLSGKYFDKMKEGKTSLIAQNLKLQKKVWALSAEWCGLVQ